MCNNAYVLRADGSCSTTAQCPAGYYEVSAATATSIAICNPCGDMNCATCTGAGMGQCTQCVVGFTLSHGMCSKMVQASIANTGGSGLGLGVIIGAAVGGVLFLLLLLLCLMCLLLPILRRRREEKKEEPPPSQELVQPPQEPESPSKDDYLTIDERTQLDASVVRNPIYEPDLEPDIPLSKSSYMMSERPLPEEPAYDSNAMNLYESVPDILPEIVPEPKMAVKVPIPEPIPAQEPVFEVTPAEEPALEAAPPGLDMDEAARKLEEARRQQAELDEQMRKLQKEIDSLGVVKKQVKLIEMRELQAKSASAAAEAKKLIEEIEAGKTQLGDYLTAINLQ